MQNERRKKSANWIFEKKLMNTLQNDTMKWKKLATIVAKLQRKYVNKYVIHMYVRTYLYFRLTKGHVILFQTIVASFIQRFLHSVNLQIVHLSLTINYVAIF